MLLPTALLLVGFVVLISGGNWLVTGASAIAKRMNVSPLVIGLTIVAFGTSAPELVINLLAGVNGSTDIAIGNIIGSNISNILLILGIAALIYPLKVGRGTVWKEIPLSLLATLILFLVANDLLIDGQAPNIISRADGLILLAFFVIFIYYTFGIAKVQGKDSNGIKDMKPWLAVVYILAGTAFLGWGGDLVVSNAVKVSRLLGLSETLIGLTIVAIGTSLPELVTSASAAMRKQTDIAIGNVVGSNIFNLFWILGLSSVVTPLPFSDVNNFDIAVVILASLLLFLFMFFGDKHKLDRWQGGIFVGLYFGYIGYLVGNAL